MNEIAIGQALPAGVESKQIASVEATKQRSMAEIQSAVLIAKTHPRDELNAIKRINAMCERKTLAEGAEYNYSKGGQEITGASINLLKAIAGQWGNLRDGWEEVSRKDGESVIRAYAWDLESNTMQDVTFTVRHWIDTKNGGYAPSDERALYELLANQAARRLRACLEAVIPRDIVEDARVKCAQTRKEKSNFTREDLQKMVDAFSGAGVPKEALEKRFQRNVESFQIMQVIELRKIWTSLANGASQISDWFDIEEDEPGKPAEPEKKTAKQKLKEAAKGKKGAKTDAKTSQQAPQKQAEAKQEGKAEGQGAAGDNPLFAGANDVQNEGGSSSPDSTGNEGSEPGKVDAERQNAFGVLQTALRRARSTDGLMKGFERVEAALQNKKITQAQYEELKGFGEERLSELS